MFFCKERSFLPSQVGLVLAYFFALRVSAQTVYQGAHWCGKYDSDETNCETLPGCEWGVIVDPYEDDIVTCKTVPCRGQDQRSCDEAFYCTWHEDSCVGKKCRRQEDSCVKNPSCEWDARMLTCEDHYCVDWECDDSVNREKIPGLHPWRSCLGDCDSMCCQRGPTYEPTEGPTPEPTAEPTAYPTPEPTMEPTLEPTMEPTSEPSMVPTGVPTGEPTATPTAVPSTTPSAVPTTMPTSGPSAIPTAVPTHVPTAQPTWGCDVCTYGFEQKHPMEQTPEKCNQYTGCEENTPYCCQKACVTCAPLLAPLPETVLDPSMCPASGCTDTDPHCCAKVCPGKCAEGWEPMLVTIQTPERCTEEGCHDMSVHCCQKACLDTCAAGYEPLPLRAQRPEHCPIGGCTDTDPHCCEKTCPATCSAGFLPLPEEKQTPHLCGVGGCEKDDVHCCEKVCPAVCATGFAPLPFEERSPEACGAAGCAADDENCCEPACPLMCAPGFVHLALEEQTPEMCGADGCSGGDENCCQLACQECAPGFGPLAIQEAWKCSRGGCTPTDQYCCEKACPMECAEGFQLLPLDERKPHMCQVFGCTETDMYCCEVKPPTSEPTSTPSLVPTMEPTSEPTAVPTSTPTAAPSATPTATPTATPSATPSATPTATPTATPSAMPTADPTPQPTYKGQWTSSSDQAHVEWEMSVCCITKEKCGNTMGALNQLYKSGVLPRAVTAVTCESMDKQNSERYVMGATGTAMLSPSTGLASERRREEGADADYTGAWTVTYEFKAFGHIDEAERARLGAELMDALTTMHIMAEVQTALMKIDGLDSVSNMQEPELKDYTVYQLHDPKDEAGLSAGAVFGIIALVLVVIACPCVIYFTENPIKKMISRSVMQREDGIGAGAV